MATKYTLYYWPIAFRGQFAKVILAHTQTPFTMAPVPELMALKTPPPSAESAALFMAPPLLYDREADTYISQMPAISFHLGQKFNLMPTDVTKQSYAVKFVLDCNDVLAGITRNNGSMMWDEESWAEFAKDEAGGRFARWLQLFEQMSIRWGNLQPNSGWVLGTPDPTIADLSCFACFGTMEHCVPELGPFLRKWAPSVMMMCDRLKASSPGIAALMAELPQKPYCGGQIEASLRSVVA